MVYFCLLTVVIFSMGRWRKIEVNKYRKQITTIEAQLADAEYSRLEYLYLYSPIYSDYFRDGHTPIRMSETGMVSNTTPIITDWISHILKGIIRIRARRLSYLELSVK